MRYKTRYCLFCNHLDTIILQMATKSSLLLGTVIKINKIGLQQIACAQVRCRQNHFSEYLKMYFAKPTDLWAVDKKLEVKPGDTVLIEPVSAADRPTTTVTHTVKKLIMAHGNVIDPITKKRILQKEFFEDMELKRSLVDEVVEVDEQVSTLPLVVIVISGCTLFRDQTRRSKGEVGENQAATVVIQ